jgi:PAS domain S-box-containing protein
MGNSAAQAQAASRATAAAMHAQDAGMLATLAEAVPQPVLVVDAQGRIVRANHRMLQATAWEAQVLAGRSWLWLIDEQDQARARAAWSAAAAGHEVFEIHCRWRAVPGSVGEALWRATPAHLHGRISGWVLQVTLLSQSRPATPPGEDLLHRAALEDMGAGLAHVAADGRFLAVNDRFCHIVGYRREELLGSSVQRLASALDFAADEARSAALLAGTMDQYTTRRRFVRADGSSVEVRLTVGRAAPDGRMPEHFVYVAEDAAAADARGVDTFGPGALLADFIEEAPVAMAIFDRQMRHLAASRRYRSDFALPAHVSPIGRTPAQVLPDMAQRWAQAHARALQGEEAYGETRGAAQAAGPAQGLRWCMRPWRNAHGDVAATVLFAETIPAQHQARAQLRELHDLLHLAVEAGHVGTWSVDLATMECTLSPMMTRLMGCPQHCLRQGVQELRSLIVPEDRPRHEASVAAAIEQRGTFANEFRVRRADSGVHWLHSRGEVVCDELGQPLRLHGAAVDVTARRQAEEKLRMAEAGLRTRHELLTAVLAATDNIVYAKDREGRYLLMNEAGARLLGRSVAQIIGRTDEELLDRQTAAAWRENDLQVLDAGTTLRIQESAEFADGPRTYLSTKTPLHGEDGALAGLVGVSVDITEQVQAQAALAGALDVKEALLREVNHRVKNSLQVISSLLSLQQRNLQDADARAAVAEAHARVSVVARLHEQLYSSGAHASVNYCHYAKGLAIDTLALLGASQRIELEFECHDPLPVAMDVAVPLSLAVAELLTNAVKYAFASSQAGTVLLRIEHDAGALSVLVADDGVGLPAGFEPGTSAGLGMRIVRALVLQCDGRLEVLRRERGAAFLIVIGTPCAAA